MRGAKNTQSVCEGRVRGKREIRGKRIIAGTAATTRLAGKEWFKFDFGANIRCIQFFYCKALPFSVAHCISFILIMINIFASFYLHYVL